MRALDVDAVSDLIRSVSAAVVEPAFRALAAGDVEEKAAGEVVTRVDRDAEQLLTDGLRALLPGVPVVGEEAAAADASLLGLVSSAERTWLVDPLDGTSAYVDGSAEHGVLVCLLERGETTHAWVWQPVPQRMHVAQRGAGALVDGRPVRTPPGRGELRLAALTRFLPDELRAPAAAAVTASAAPAAAFTYPAVVGGELDAVLYWRTLPWDHAPGTLLLTEAGGVARRPDGSPYVVGDGRSGLLVAADEARWQHAAAALALV